ncbi:Hypothetical predicted protein [Pelobates cultripes]|uniref:Uncharacterized protein n=1 Tax=Pelobates cultripes TaxID=61616 RepID=A0AAD1W927_PELCU|nr:Hypothetical predicted protein [Pelobates cultripes]
MLLVDRIHRLPRPRFLPETAPRDVLLRMHYYHIKELILKSSRNKATPLEGYPNLLIFADLSASTLRRRKEFAQVANSVRAHGLRFRWGFPTKMLVTKDNTTQVITSPEDGLRKLQSWGFMHQRPEPHTPPARRIPLDWHKA